MFFTLPLDFSWNFPNKLSLVANGGLGLTSQCDSDRCDVLSWEELSGSSAGRVPGTARAEDGQPSCHELWHMVPG